MALGRILTMSSWNTTTSPSTGVPLTSVAWYACTIKIVSSFLWLMEIWKCLEDNVSLIIKSGIKVVQNSADWNSVPTIICALENGASNLPKVGGKVFISPASTTREKGGGKACALTTTTSSTMGSKTSSTNQPKLVKWKGAVPMRGDTGRNGSESSWWELYHSLSPEIMWLSLVVYYLRSKAISCGHAMASVEE